MGELHLEVIVDRMLREFKVQANVGRPQVSYRETIRKPAKGEGRFVRQTGGKGQYGHAVLTVEPLERGGGVEFESKIVGGTVPREYFKPIEQGIRDALAGGVVAGYPGDRPQGHRSSTARTTRSTRPRWPSRSPARMAAKAGVAQGRSRRSWSR